jgi:alkylhydroperoxidase/carboxymuconolactone decarboxylase family protein YurZ
MAPGAAGCRMGQGGRCWLGPMTPDQVNLLRKLALNEREATNLVMSGSLADSLRLDAGTAALVRLAALLSVDSDPATFQWAAELAMAAGVDDDEIFHALLVVAPIIGVARMTAALPHLMAALELEVVEG